MAQAKKALSKTAKKSTRGGTTTTAAASNGKKSGARASVKTYSNYIGGEWVPAASGEYFENLNPADTRDCIGRFPVSNADDVERAVAAAKSAAEGWRRIPAPRRAEILFRLGNILIRDKDAYSADMTREMGKVLKETGGDVQEAIDCISTSPRTDE
jgi:aldehyde dehydrogenase (NAD+)